MPTSVSTSPHAGRAAPLSREQRRAAIVEATLPLLRRHGQSVTTRQIAEASGIGEGTIFRVFADKAELVDACVAAAFDQTPTLAEFAAIDRRLALQPRLVAAVTVLQRRLRSVMELMVALGFPQPPEPKRDRSVGHGNSLLLAAFADVLAPDAAQLRMPPREVAALARLLTFAASHPKITDDQPLSAEQIADVLLHGVAVGHGARGPAC
jgi:AcrR family transcriptional regulator